MSDSLQPTKKDNFILFNSQNWDFPGGPVVENLPADAADMGSIPGPGRFYMLQQLRVPATTTEPAL